MKVLSDILALEQVSSSRIYIYRDGKGWSLYGRSAYRFASIYDANHDFEHTPCRFQLHWVQAKHEHIAIVSIADDDLHKWFDRRMLKKIGTDCLYLDDQEIVSDDDYRYWTEGLTIAQNKVRQVGYEGYYRKQDVQHFSYLRRRLEEFDTATATHDECVAFIAELLEYAREH